MTSPDPTGNGARRRLLMMRHAKSDWPPGVVDRQRPLSERGRRDAPAAGRWIADDPGLPDVIVVSPAVRTQQTLELVAATWQIAVPTRIDDRIYEATWEQLADVIAELPTEANSAVVIGHNPGLEEFAAHWPRGRDPQAAATLRSKFPTCAIADISIQGSWADAEDSRLERIVIPRG
jgi:phosphohistidine phosphatase